MAQNVIRTLVNRHNNPLLAQNDLGYVQAQKLTEPQEKSDVVIEAFRWTNVMEVPCDPSFAFCGEFQNFTYPNLKIILLFFSTLCEQNHEKKVQYSTAT